MAERPNSLSWRILATLVVAAIIAGGTFALGFSVKGGTVTKLRDDIHWTEKKLADAQLAIAEREQRVDDAQGEAGDLRTLSNRLKSEIKRLEQTGALVSSLQTRVQTLTDQVRALESTGDSDKQLREIADRLAVDRLLIAELRKSAPQERDEARVYWADIKRLAVESAASLGSKVNKVTTALNPYFDWAERDFASSQESTITYVLTGANSYEAYVEEFWSAFLLVVIDRIDAIVAHTS